MRRRFRKRKQVSIQQSFKFNQGFQNILGTPGPSPLGTGVWLTLETRASPHALPRQTWLLWVKPL